MRRLVLGAGGALLGGCASDSLSLLGATLPRFGAAARGNGYPLSDAQIKAIPYASMGVHIGKSAGVVTILASVDGERLHWASADRIVLITERGRLVKTIGDAVLDYEMAVTTDADRRALDEKGNPRLYRWPLAKNLGE